MFNPLTSVTWTSQSQGTAKKKTGVVICLLRATPRESPNFYRLKNANKDMAFQSVRLMNLPSKLPREKEWFLKKLEKIEFASSQDRYLVWVSDANAFYTPQTKLLEHQNGISAR
jgi:hypothetical protein